MRFKVDENLPAAVTELLRSAGHDAATVRDEGLAGHEDADVAVAAQREGRAIVTLDTDFANIRAYPPAGYAGLIVLRLGSQDRAHVSSVVSALVPWLDREPLVGRLWIAEDDRLRIRSSEDEEP